MVAMSVWPTDASPAGRVDTEAKWRKMARGWEMSGVMIQGTGANGELSPSLAYPTLTVQPGTVWIDGHYCEITGSQQFTVTANGLLVVRFDPTAGTADLVYTNAQTTPTVSLTGATEIPIAKIVSSALHDVRLLVHPTIPGASAPTAEARDLNLPTPRAGMTCWVIAESRQYAYSGSGWGAVGVVNTVQLHAQSAATFTHQNSAIEVAYGTFNVPAAFKVGDQLRITAWGSLYNPATAGWGWNFRFYLAGNAYSSLYYFPAANGNKRGFWQQWWLHQEAAGNSWLRAYALQGPADGNIDSQGDPLSGANTLSHGTWSNPQVTPAGAEVRLCVQMSTAVAANLANIRGWRAEYLVAP